MGEGSHVILPVKMYLQLINRFLPVKNYGQGFKRVLADTVCQDY